MSNTPCTCTCHKPTLNSDDLTNMFANGQWDEINAAHTAGRFEITDDNTNH